MPKVDKIAFRGTTETRDAASALLRNTGDLALVIRDCPRMLVLRCPCGCGDELLINLDRRAGKAWRYYRSKEGLTLYPSYWRDSHCGSHFVLWNDNIYWCYSRGDTEEDEIWRMDSPLDSAVLDALPFAKFVEYTEVAETLNEIPWAVLRSCRRLVDKKHAQEAPLPNHGRFRRI